MVIIVGMFVAGKYWPSVKVLDSLQFRLDVGIKVLPVSLMFMGMVCCNNYFLMRVGVGFYAVGKSLAIPFSVGMSYLVLSQTTSLFSMLACAVISFGVFVSSYYDADITWLSLAFGLLSSFFTAGYQIAVKRGLLDLDGDQWRLSFYNSTWVVVILTPIALLLGEGSIALQALFPSAYDSLAFSSFLSPSFWFSSLNGALVFVLVSGGIVGFLIGQATYLSIHYTSALAHHVTGAVKACLQTALGVLIWSEAATFSGISGLLLTLLGSYLFLVSRSAPPKPAPARENPV